MRLAARALTIGVALSCAIGVGEPPARAQAQPGVAILFRELQSDGSTDQAEDKLFNLAQADPSARRYLALHLPVMIERGPKRFDPRHPNREFPDPEWSNAVHLAAGLRIAEAAPALVKWIEVRTSPLTDSYIQGTLAYQPAGRALVQIGDPAVPTLQRTIVEGAREQRWEAMYALLLINSPKAKAVLQDYEANGGDRELAPFIKRGLR